MKAIFKREFRSYFQTMSGFVFVALSIAFFGLFMVMYNLFYGFTSISYAISDMMLVMSLLIPALTVGAISRERKNSTDRLLRILPVTSEHIVLGKYFALICVFLIPVTIGAIFPLWLDILGEVNFAVSYASLLCFVLFGAALIAISLFISAVIDNAVYAALINYGALVLLYATNIVIGIFVPVGKLKNILISFSLFGRFDSFVYGVFDIGTVIYYLAIAIIFVLLSVYTVKKRRSF